MYEAGYLHLRIPSIRLENQHKSEIVHAKRLARCQGIRQMGVVGRTLTIQSFVCWHSHFVCSSFHN